jgi:hypothetical protein
MKSGLIWSWSVACAPKPRFGRQSHILKIDHAGALSGSERLVAPAAISVRFRLAIIGLLKRRGRSSLAEQKTGVTQSPQGVSGAAARSWFWKKSAFRVFDLLASLGPSLSRILA